jgi:hypothetical protein
MDVNLPSVLGELEAVFARYEQALVHNDIAVLDELFWADPRTVRYGAAEVLYGIEAIRAFRRDRPTQGLARTLQQTVLTTFGRDFATASTLFKRDSAGGKLGCQQQTWVRFAPGWRIVAAHVSVTLAA